MSAAIRAGYKQTEVGVIPEDWDVDSIVNLAAITTGDKNTQDRIDDGAYPFFVRSSTVEHINSYTFDGEAVLTAGDGVGTGKIFHYINGKFDFHQRVYKISHFGDRLNGYFFYLYFSNHFYSRIMQMTAKSSVDSVRREMIADMRMPVPPTAEQLAIATALSDMDAMLAKLDQFIAKKRDLKQAAMQQLLTGQTRLPGFQMSTGYKQTDMGAVPMDWNVIALGDIGECLIGLTYKPSNIKAHGVLVLRSSNVQASVLAFDDCVYVDTEIPERIRVQDGDILVCVRNGSRALIGKCALLDHRVVGQTFGAFMSVFRTEDSAFIFQQFTSNLIKRQINENIGATINQITNANLNSFKMLLPSNCQERQAIATVLSDMDAELAALEARRDKTCALKQGMMQELLTGRIRLI